MLRRDRAIEDAVPDESTILRFRHLLERHQLTQKLFELVRGLLEQKRPLLKSGTIVDATLIDAPLSTKNEDRRYRIEPAAGGDEIHIACASDFAELWLQPRIGTFKAAHRHILFCINGEGDAPLRIGQMDCEISFGPRRANTLDELLFRDFVLPISSPENTHRISRVARRDCLEGFPLLQLDFYKEDPRVPNWSSWIKARRLRRAQPNRGIRFQRARAALEAVRANAGLAICGLALLDAYIADGSLSLPFPAATGRWTEHAFQARFRQDALLRPQVKRFREWLLSQAAVTDAWLFQLAQSAAGPRGQRNSR